MPSYPTGCVRAGGVRAAELERRRRTSRRRRRRRRRRILSAAKI
jgi:hypothetical protein